MEAKSDEAKGEEDFREHKVKGDGLEDASEETKKPVEKEKVKQDEVPTLWEDAEEEGSQGTDIKSVLEAEMEISEDEAEEKVDDDDLGEDDREHFINVDGFKDDSEDTADEDVMKQDEAPKNQEISKKELASAVDITDATGTKAEIQEGVPKDIIEVDMMKQDEALFNRENVPEVRMEPQRKPNSQHSKNWRLKKMMPT